MQNGDISNVVQPKVYLVFEGALGFIDAPRLPEFNHAASSGDWLAAWSVWDINDLMARKIWDVTKRQGIRVALVTYVSSNEGAASGLQTWADEHGLPIVGTLAIQPERFARELSYMPDVACVYDASYSTVGFLGSKGRHLRDIHRFCQF